MSDSEPQPTYPEDMAVLYARLKQLDEGERYTVEEVKEELGL